MCPCGMWSIRCKTIGQTYTIQIITCVSNRFVPLARFPLRNVSLSAIASPSHTSVEIPSGISCYTYDLVNVRVHACIGCLRMSFTWPFIVISIINFAKLCCADSISCKPLNSPHAIRGRNSFENQSKHQMFSYTCISSRSIFYWVWINIIYFVNRYTNKLIYWKSMRGKSIIKHCAECPPTHEIRLMEHSMHSLERRMNSRKFSAAIYCCVIGVHRLDENSASRRERETSIEKVWQYPIHRR